MEATTALARQRAQLKIDLLGIWLSTYFFNPSEKLRAQTLASMSLQNGGPESVSRIITKRAQRKTLIENASRKIIDAMSFRDWFAFAKRKSDDGTSLNVANESEIAPHLELGRRGERLAAIFLESEGYSLVASNFVLPVGRNIRGAVVNSEIDIIAFDGPMLCFVEVKTRTSDDFAAPEQSVDRRKQRQITRAARVYRRMFGLLGADYRYDVVSIVLPTLREDGTQPAPRVELLKNFWTDAKFRKRHWSHDRISY